MKTILSALLLLLSSVATNAYATEVKNLCALLETDAIFGWIMDENEDEAGLNARTKYYKSGTVVMTLNGQCIGSPDCFRGKYKGTCLKNKVTLTREPGSKHSVPMILSLSATLEEEGKVVLTGQGSDNKTYSIYLYPVF